MEFTTAREERRHLALDGTYNVRDIGGYPTEDGRTTRWRVLIRADSPHRLSAEAQRELLDLGLRTIIDSMKDWRDADDFHRANGAEDDYYQAHYEEHGMSEPYLCKNANFDSVRELLLVREMTPEILFGSANVEKYGFRKKESAGVGEDQEFTGVFDLLTTWGGGLYYDTASDDLLSGLTTDARAQQELERRESGDWTNARAQTHRVTSTRFTITSTGRIASSDVTRTIVAVIKKVGSFRRPRVEIMEWHDNYVGSVYAQFGADI